MKKHPPETPLPLAIVAEKKRFLAEPNFQEKYKAVLDKLTQTTGPWIYLKTRDPIISRPQLAEEWSFLGETPDAKWSDREIALQVVFKNSLHLATSSTSVITTAKKAEIIDEYRARAKRLRDEAAFLKKQGSASEAAHHGRAIELAAEYLEDQIGEVNDGWRTLTVGKLQIDGRARAFGMQLAETTRFLYGESLYGIVAQITTAALGVEVTRDAVKYWCEEKSV
jgi:hypothetical protein